MGIQTQLNQKSVMTQSLDFFCCRWDLNPHLQPKVSPWWPLSHWPSGWPCNVPFFQVQRTFDIWTNLNPVKAHKSRQLFTHFHENLMLDSWSNILSKYFGINFVKFVLVVLSSFLVKITVFRPILDKIDIGKLQLTFELSNY